MMLRIITLFVFVLSLLSFTNNYNNRQCSGDEVDLLLFYGSFDHDRDGLLCIEEIVEFYKWCQTEIKYNAHDGYQSPVETFNTKTGDCLDLSLLIAHFIYVYNREEIQIGEIAVGNHGERINHACCLLPVTGDIIKGMQKRLGYNVSYFDISCNGPLFVIIDPLFGDDFGRIDDDDYYLKSVKKLEDYHFSDMSTIIINQ